MRKIDKRMYKLGIVSLLVCAATLGWNYVNFE